jgi:hypothetical protein
MIGYHASRAGIDIATGYGREGNVRSPIGAKDFSVLHSDYIESGSHAASYAVTAGGTLSPGVKWQKREAYHSPSSTAEVTNGGAIPPRPHDFMTLHLIN